MKTLSIILTVDDENRSPDVVVVAEHPRPDGRRVLGAVMVTAAEIQRCRPGVAVARGAERALSTLARCEGFEL